MRELLERMSAEEFEEWRVVDRYFYPLGTYAVELVLARGFSRVTNTLMNGFQFKAPKYVTPGDLMWSAPTLEGTPNVPTPNLPPAQPWQVMKGMMMGLAMRLNGSVAPSPDKRK